MGVIRNSMIAARVKGKVSKMPVRPAVRNGLKKVTVMKREAELKLLRF